MNTTPFAAAAQAVQAVDSLAAATTVELHAQLTKPPGSLGELEQLAARLAGIARTTPPPLPEPAAVCVFAGDHGVVAEGVTAWPQDVTVQMVMNIATGGAAVNALARQVGATVTVVDVGVALPLPAAVAGVVERRVRAGTGNLAVEPAMTVEETTAALDVGAEMAAQLVAGGARLLVTGEMGIGNTTSAAALIASLTGAVAADVTGPGAGATPEILRRKQEVIATAIRRVHKEHDALAVLRELGGLEIAALTGYIVGGAAAGVPVLLDGVIALAAAVVAARHVPEVTGYLIAGHRSTEPAATVALGALQLRPVLELDLRLGEGTGALLAVPIVQAAARVMHEMATFDSAGVTGKTP